MFPTSIIPSPTTATSVWPLESVPMSWTDEDVCFFACTFDVFPQAFTLGASVLLASYDELCVH